MTTLKLDKLIFETDARRALLGVAYDGDADRCILVDETGTVRDGDDLLAVAATAMQASGDLGSDDVAGYVDPERAFQSAAGDLLLCAFFWCLDAPEWGPPALGEGGLSGGIPGRRPEAGLRTGTRLCPGDDGAAAP